MLKKTITYTDYNGTERTKDYYFNLTKAELMKMEMGTTGGLTEKIKNITDNKDVPAIIEVFEDLIKKSYGVKTTDGGFKKNPEYVEEFVSTEAYSVLFMELATDADAAVAFINGIIPADMSKQKAVK